MDDSRKRNAGLASGIFVLALLYFATGRLSLLLAIPPGYATAVWPGAGIALAALLLYGRRLWPGVVLGSFLVNIGVGLDPASSPVDLRSVAIALTIALGAAAQALLGVVLVGRFLRRDPGLLELRNIVGLLVLGGPVSCLLNASWGVATLFVSGLLDSSEYGYSWMTWWVGDSIGVLIFLPLAFIWLAKPGQLWNKRRFAVSCPLALFFSLAVVGYILASEQEQKVVGLAFSRSGEAVGNALDKQVVRYLEVVHSIQSYFAGSSDVNRHEFRAFVARSLEQVGGIHALSWNPRITAAQRDTFEAATRRDGLTGFRITERAVDGQLVPAAERPEYVAVHYIEPHAANIEVLGYDVYSQPERKAALDVARDTGRAVATGPVTLIQDSGDQTGMLVFVPVYAAGEIPDGIEARRAALFGYAVGVFRLGDVLAAALAGTSAAHMEVRLYDESAAGEPKPLAFYRVDNRGALEAIAAPDPAVPEGAMGYSSRHEVAGRTWRLALILDRHYLLAHRSWAAWWVLSGGLSFASLLGLFLLALTGRWILDERRAQELATANAGLTDQIAQRGRIEQALQMEKERAEVTLHSIGDAVITTNADGAIEYLNPVAEKLTEWSSEEAHGRPLTMVFRVINEDTRQPAMDPMERCRGAGRAVNLANHTVLISRTGREYNIQDTAAPIRDRHDRMLGVVVVFNDVSESRRMAREAAHHATHDNLTGLANRREFDRRLERALASSKQYGNFHALCYLDLDQFKIVNDTCGHRAGDELLRHVTRLLSNEVRERDTLARLGGDEFGLLLDNCPRDKALEIANRLVNCVRDYRFLWDGRPFSIGVSIGLVFITGEQVETAESLLSHADVACYAAKGQGRNRVHIYRADISGADPYHREILRVADLHSAIEQDRFRLYCQPIWSLGDGPPAIEWYEILLRLLDEDNRLVLPGHFVPVAERFDLMGQIDRWVLRTVFDEYHRLFPGQTAPNIAVNLSGNLLGDEELLPFLRMQFDSHDISPERICFEVTETAAIRNIRAASELMRAVRGLGVKFALDDFGSGLSSFTYLKALPVNYLKIDGNLVRRIAEDAADRAIVEAINQLARRLGIRTVAEYAETPECVRVLREIGVDYAQGYALAEPEPLPRAGTEVALVS